MAFTAPIDNFRFPESSRGAFAGKRVLITGSDATAASGRPSPSRPR